MNIKTYFKGLEPSDSIVKYFEEKVSKYDEMLSSAISFTVEFRDNISNSGVNTDFEVDVNIVLPKAVIRVEEVGEDMYAMIDKASDVIGRRLKRYLDKKENWDGVKPWKELENQAEEIVEEIPETDEFINYTIKVSKRVKLENLSPMSEEEAIERMELAGDSQILFKHAKTSEMAMIYRNSKGEYILVQPSI